MKTIKINVPAYGDFRSQVIPLGKMGDGRGDTSIRQIVFDCSQLIKQYGAGTAEVLHQRSGDTAPYICDVEQDGATVIWDISKSDTAMAGNGQAELRWYVGSSVQKTTHYQTLTSTALKADAEPPSPFQPWVDKVMEAAKQIMQGGVDTETLNQAIRQAVSDYLANNNIDAGLSEDEVKSIAEDALETYWNAHKDELKDANQISYNGTTVAAELARQSEENVRLEDNQNIVKCNVPTPYNTDETTHPSVIYFESTKFTHRWWMAHTPYPNSDDTLENCCVCWSDDGINWHDDGISNPVIDRMEATGCNSDAHITYNPTSKKLEAFIRHTAAPNEIEKLYRVTSSDGFNWSSPELVYTASSVGDHMLSPVILYTKANSYVFVYFADNQEKIDVYYNKSGDVSNLTYLRSFNPVLAENPDYKIWHFDVKKIGDAYHMVASFRPLATDYNTDLGLGGAEDNRFICYLISDDNETWSVPIKILQSGGHDFDKDSLYRPCLVDEHGRIHMYYGCYQFYHDGGKKKRWSIARMNQIRPIVSKAFIDALNQTSVIAENVSDSNPNARVGVVRIDPDYGFAINERTGTLYGVTKTGKDYEDASNAMMFTKGTFEAIRPSLGGSNKPFAGKKVVVYGTSITYNCGKSGFGIGYTGYIKELCGFSEVVNRGRSGKPIASEGGRYGNVYAFIRGDSSTGTPGYTGDADILILEGCTNDWASIVPIEEMKDTLRTGFNWLRDNHPNTLVICCTSPVRSTPPREGYEALAPLKDYCTAMIEVCNEYGIPCVNWYTSSWASTTPYTADGLHPNDDGYKLLALSLADCINNYRGDNVSKVINVVENRDEQQPSEPSSSEQMKWVKIANELSFAGADSIMDCQNAKTHIRGWVRITKPSSTESIQLVMNSGTYGDSLRIWEGSVSAMTLVQFDIQYMNGYCQIMTASGTLSTIAGTGVAPKWAFKGEVSAINNIHIVTQSGNSVSGVYSLYKFS